MKNVLYTLVIQFKRGFIFFLFLPIFFIFIFFIFFIFLLIGDQ